MIPHQDNIKIVPNEFKRSFRFISVPDNVAEHQKPRTAKSPSIRQRPLQGLRIGVHITHDRITHVNYIKLL